jgi:hypothetical protein
MESGQTAAAVSSRAPCLAGELAGPPFNRWAFQHIRELIPTARIDSGGGSPIALPQAERHLSALEFRSGGRDVTVDEVLAETYTDGFLVLHRGQIVTEQYFNGMREDRLTIRCYCKRGGRLTPASGPGRMLRSWLKVRRRRGAEQSSGGRSGAG